MALHLWQNYNYTHNQTYKEKKNQQNMDIVIE